MVVAVLMLVLLGWTVWQNVRIAERVDNTVKSTTMLEGEYSLDGGEWKPIDNTKPINEHFHKAVFKGNFTKQVKANYTTTMDIVSKNVWYTLCDGSGEVLDEYRRSPGDMEEGSGYMAEKMINTPGYYIMTEYVQIEPEYKSDDKFTLVVEYPYELDTESFSDCFYVMTSYSDGLYLNFFFEILPAGLMFLIVCFFGVFFFPVASGLLGRIDFRYIAFGALCFFAGLFMVVNKISGYMNLWVIDPTVCMMTDKITGCLFATAVLIYLRSLLSGRLVRTIASSLIAAFFALTLVCVILHAACSADMMMTSGIRYAVVIAFAAVMLILLCIGIRGKKDFALFNYLISWIPLAASLVVDILDYYIHISGTKHLQIGLAITIIYQMIRFGIDFSRQYKEAIRYQQVQRELYEAKVSVMVSQIRPHFMYNALSSIAILCKLNPDTAYDATIAFSDYLRGNMDSLRQTAPVPFEIELEHLKKYLYIEKLRFDDKLSIEYDIKDVDFELPLLSIQPLVENAVKHGVGMKEDGGTVKISTRETETAHEVIIEDDGVGFDVNETKEDGRSHIGMENTKKRLHEMCGGEVIIESEIGKGTVARVIIPKKEETDK